MNIKIYHHRGVDIVISWIRGDKWLVTWKYPGEDESVQVYRYGNRWDALAYARVRINSWLENGMAQESSSHPSDNDIVWRSGGDWWSGIEVENGVVPSDAVPYGLIDDEWQPLT